MTDLLTALALALFFEGAAYALFPDVMQAMMRQALALPPVVLRWVGLAAASLAVALVAAIRATVG